MTPEGILIENMLMIANKDGDDVPFKLNTAQRKIDSNLSGRDIIPKARQEGVSSYFLARGTVKCLTRRNRRSVVISHDAESTERMLQKVHYFLEHMDPKPVVGRASKNELTFPKMNSMFYIGTAGAKKFGRGDTITDLHCSEVAFWENGKELMGGLTNAVPLSGEISIESTGNGQGNYYHNMCCDARSHKSHYTCHFLDWLSFDEYDLPVSKKEHEYIIANLDPDLDEDILMHDWGLTTGQIKFRRMRLADIDWDLRLFDQEYPKTFDECFQASGRGIFSKVRYIKDSMWVRDGLHMWKLSNHPIVGRRYAIGADVSAGIGQDRSVAYVTDIDTMEQVGEWASDIIPPDEFGDKLEELGKMYNTAYITVEANNYGITTLDHLATNYPSDHIYYEEKMEAVGANEYQTLVNLGFRTTSKSKPFIIGKLRTALVNDIIIHSTELKNELSTFIETVSNRLEAESGCHDDRVMALAMVIAGCARSLSALALPEPVINTTYDDPFSFENIISELRSKGNKFPIKKQVGGPLGWRDDI